MAYAVQVFHAPTEGYIVVDGVRLHYWERGTGSAVVLLHGNGSMIGDFVSSGITDRIATSHRVIVFDRPGFGYSERPRGRTWGPSEQAKLLLRAFGLLGIERPVVVGHSWGTLVALAISLEAPEHVAGLVLLSGYYYPVPHVIARSRPRTPIMNEVMLHAMMPFVGHAMVLSALMSIFAPCVVPARFWRQYSIRLALRPSQLRAVAEEAEMLPDSAEALCRHYKELDVPVHLIAGSDDRVVETERHSARLHRELGSSTFCSVPGKGHMIHHAAPLEVVTAITEMGEKRQMQGKSKTALRARQRLDWLNVTDSDRSSKHFANIETPFGANVSEPRDGVSVRRGVSVTMH